MPVIHLCDCCKQTCGARERWVTAPWRTTRDDRVQDHFLVCDECWDRFKREQKAAADAHNAVWRGIVNRFGFGARFREAEQQP